MQSTCTTQGDRLIKRNLISRDIPENNTKLHVIIQFQEIPVSKNGH